MKLGLTDRPATDFHTGKYVFIVCMYTCIKVI
jgi:hypothetical protein